MYLLLRIYIYMQQQLQQIHEYCSFCNSSYMNIVAYVPKTQWIFG